MIDPDAVPEDNDGKKLDYDLEALQRILKNAVIGGELAETTPIQSVSRLITSQLYGVMTCWCMSNGAMDTDELLADYCDKQLMALISPYLKDKR